MGIRIRGRTRSIGLLAAVLVLQGCKRDAIEPPPRATDSIETPSEQSFVSVPVAVDISNLGPALERALPRRLWSINQHFDRCVAPQRVKLFGARIPVTPKLGCDVVGEVTRGPIRLRGAGADLYADMPINAVVAAERIGGIIRRETATGSAMIHVRVRIDIDRQWNAVPHAAISYDWKNEPGIDFLGQRIRFTDKADEKLAPLVARAEQSVRAELAGIDLRRKVDALWRSGFAVLSLNRSNPPVWMRVTPKGLHYGGYALNGMNLRLNLGLSALTGTFVGDRPEPEKPTPLPPMQRLQGAVGKVRFFLPVIAQYQELEPVLLRALVKRSARPFVLPAVGPVMAEFREVTAYGTTGSQVAVGIRLKATPQDTRLNPSEGTVWLTAMPDNDENSRVVRFRNLKVKGETDRIGSNLALKLAEHPAIGQVLGESLTQNFQRDFDKLMVKIGRAIDDDRKGDIILRAQVEEVESGRLRAAGQGVYLPVWATGNASIVYAPRRQ